MNRYTINIVASYGPETDPVPILTTLTHDGSALLSEILAVDIVSHESVMHPVRLHTVTFVYEAEGRDLDQAAEFALALYKRDAEKIGLPEPETLIANEAEED
jgi:hypothetical protein